MSTLLDFLFPPACLGCGRSGAQLCATCAGLIPTAPATGELWLEAASDYNHPFAKRAVWLLKYRGSRVIARDLAQKLAERWLEILTEIIALQPASAEQVWLVVPIPVTKKRERERGFNQALALARHLVAADPSHLELASNLLIKTRETISQMKIRNRAERLKNLTGAFAVPGNKLETITGKNILLIDDVITTGATMTEARKTLLAAGAKSVHGLAFAHG